MVAPLHRDLGVFLMRGVDPGRLMAQLMGKETGLSRGKDSFLHGGDLEHAVFGSTSMLGSSLPVAVGAALKSTSRRKSMSRWRFLAKARPRAATSTRR